MGEPVHVYQNRRPGLRIEDMHFCATCNGYYGVPHRECPSRLGCRHLAFGQLSAMCACRKHQEAAGLPREGSYGWIVGEDTE